MESRKAILHLYNAFETHAPPRPGPVGERTPQLERRDCTPPSPPTQLIHEKLSRDPHPSNVDTMTLHLGLSHGHHRNTTTSQETREAKRLLKEKVRDDWEYPALPAFQLPVRRAKAVGGDEGDGDGVAGFKFRKPDDHERRVLGEGGLEFEPLEWREREYSSEESGAEEEENAVASPASRSSSKRSGTFRFENPDSVGDQLADRKVARKRKRQKALDEEVQWNDGLSHWMARRDAWCCARTTQQVQLMETHEHIASSTSASATSTPRTSTSTSSRASTEAPLSSPCTTPDLLPNPTLLQTQPAAPPSELLVPLAPPILASHPLRRRITSELYPEIYNKIILQSRSPSIPINLLTLIRALVQGWKDDGEWPPKQTPVEKSIAGRRRKDGAADGVGGGFKNGVKSVARVLRITGGESSHGSREREKG